LREELKNNLNIHFQIIYKDILDQNEILKLINKVLDLFENKDQGITEPNWSQKDIFLISYGDSIVETSDNKLKVLSKFLNKYCKKYFNNVHILPFFPYSSDDGFSITDYEVVRPDLGNWHDMKSLSKDFRVMSDIVINHASIKSKYFKNFIENKEDTQNFFIKLKNVQEGYESVVRPRSSDLFKEYAVNDETFYLWCTFSHDQVDFNFKNPKVLFFFIKLIHLYLKNGIRVFRLDAIAFLWKEYGTNCLNLPQTHEVVKLIRTLLNAYSKNTLLITETNLPNLENLSYFGENDEANAIYNFALPPLLLWTLVMGDSTAIRKWSMGMPPAKDNTSYFNFIASHDGIGLRPTEGILTDKERDTLVDIMTDFGGQTTKRKKADNTESVYEINISLLDALKGTFFGTDHMQLERFICCHSMMLGIEGIPAIYIHSLIGSTNDYKQVEKTNNKRSINRRSWNYVEIDKLLSDKDSINNQIYSELSKLIDIRKDQPAFHPNATQFTFNLGKNFFGFWRQSHDKRQSIFCISNVTNVFQYLDLSELNLISSNEWWDLISNEIIIDIKSTITLKAYQTMWITNY
jgi:sucrose phosphorylase